jgi:hypothetical protein
MDQSVLNSVFKKISSDELNHSSNGPWLVAIDVDYYSSTIKNMTFYDIFVYDDVKFVTK